MLKYLLSLCSISVLLLPSLLFPARTAACGGKEPETLLSLYRNSDAIYVARFDKIEHGEVTQDTDEYTVVNIKKHFDVSSALKGETRKLFVLEDQEYRYKSTAANSSETSEDPEEVEVETEEETPFGAAKLKSGDLLLLFVKKGEDGKTLELTDYRDAIKKMTTQRLESYEARIRELNSIFSAEKVDEAAIVDWIVRCTQDPETRWEGAYQFQQSFQQLKWREEQKREVQKEESEEQTDGSDAAKIVEVENVVADGHGEPEADEPTSGDEDDLDDTRYATLLSDAQKQTLMNILLERRSASSENEQSRLSLGDKVLIEVVSNWADNRFAKFLLDRLQGSGEDPYFASELMSTIAKALSDESLEKIAERYSGVLYGNDDEVVAEEEDAASPKADADVSGGESRRVEVDGADVLKAEPVSGDADPAKMTYKQLRADLLSRFIDQGLVAVAIADSLEDEKASR